MWIWMLERNNKLLKNWWFLKRKRMQKNLICKNGLLKIMFFWFRRLVASSRSTFEVFGVIFGCLWASQMGESPLGPTPSRTHKGPRGPWKAPRDKFWWIWGMYFEWFCGFPVWIFALPLSSKWNSSKCVSDNLSTQTALSLSGWEVVNPHFVRNCFYRRISSVETFFWNRQNEIPANAFRTI